MVSQKAADRINGLVQHGISSGAEPLIGSDAKLAQEPRLTPVVLKYVTKEIDLYYTERFGPIVIVVTVDDKSKPWLLQMIQNTGCRLLCSQATYKRPSD